MTVIIIKLNIMYFNLGIFIEEVELVFKRYLQEISPEKI